MTAAGEAGAARPMTVAQVAKRLGYTPRAVQLMLQRGDLDGWRVRSHWRVPKAAVEAILRRQRGA